MSGKKRVKKDFAEAQGRHLTLQSIPLPADTIAERYISAGWLLSQMDLAGGRRADDYSRKRAVTIGIDSMSFKKPVFVGDMVSIYTEVVRQGRTSITLKIESWAHRRRSKKLEKVTEGMFTFVTIDKNGKPTPIDKKLPAPAQPVTVKKAVMKESIKPPSIDKLVIRTIPMPRDTNYIGDIFGGWLLEQMDMAGGKAAAKHVNHRVATVGLKAMTFHKPVRVGDQISLYATIQKVGNTSVTVKVETWAIRKETEILEKVTEGTFTYVAVDKKHKPVPVGPGLV